MTAEPLNNQSWRPIETAPKDRTAFLATNGILLGVASHWTSVEPATRADMDRWHREYDEWASTYKGDVLSAPSDIKPKMHHIPNPDAGKVRTGWYCLAFHAYDGETATCGYDGPISFEPTHWMPQPEPPIKQASIKFTGGDCRTNKLPAPDAVEALRGDRYENVRIENGTIVGPVDPAKPMIVPALPLQHNPSRQPRYTVLDVSRSFLSTRGTCSLSQYQTQMVTCSP